MKAIEVRNLTKRFRENVALDSIYLELGLKESVLVMGANGAGKTTLLRCILGLIDFEGEVMVMGLDVRKKGKDVRRMVGYVPQQVRFPEEMTVYDLVDFVSDMKGVDITLEETLSPFGLMDTVNSPVGSLSGGLRQRLAIALSLIGNPRLIIMDEPFNNLDPMMRNTVHDMMREMMRGGKSLIVSIHNISGLITAFEKIVVLKEGRMVGVYHSEDVLRTLRPVYKVHVKSDNGWTTYRTEDLFATLTELQESGKDLRNAWIEEPDAEELLKFVGG
ncbi:putative ABC transporter ATP-binding protein YxlF [Candidatus Calditenuaceae archaeon HR02]|nr:putative ABC transporter ATP-binding protein YxlF [Candidatus Calditenuaceae archaeon HR02]